MEINNKIRRKGSFPKSNFIILPTVSPDHNVHRIEGVEHQCGLHCEHAKFA